MSLAELADMAEEAAGDALVYAEEESASLGGSLSGRGTSLSLPRLRSRSFTRTISHSMTPRSRQRSVSAALRRRRERAGIAIPPRLPDEDHQP